MNVFSAHVQNDNGIATDAELDAVVRLIAAAPDLLAAVAMMYERCIVQGMSADEDAFVRDTLRKARGE